MEGFLGRLAGVARPLLFIDAALLLVGLTLTVFNLLLVGWSVYALGHLGAIIGFLAIAGLYRDRMDGWAWVGLGVLLLGLMLALPQLLTIWETYLQTPTGIAMLVPAETYPLGLTAELVTWVGLAFYGLAARGAHALPRGVGWVFLAASVIGVLAAWHVISPLAWIIAVLLVVLGLVAVPASLSVASGPLVAPADARLASGSSQPS